MNAALAQIHWLDGRSVAPAWLFVALGIVAGGSLGSFINVVAFRLPRGMNLNHPGSQCPACHHSIRWYDNVPVLGWLRLRGRCRDCGTAIPARYPAVEALMSAVGGLLAWHSLGSWADGGSPESSVASFDFAGFAFHLLLMATIIAAALIESDGYRPPRSLVAIPLAAGLAMSLVWPRLVVSSDLVACEGISAALAGMAAALLIGVGPWAVLRAPAPSMGTLFPNWALAGLVFMGGFLGDRAVTEAGLAGMTLFVAAQLAGQRWGGIRRLGWGGSLATATLVTLLTMPTIATYDLKLPAVWAPFAGAAMMTALALVLRFSAARRTRPRG
jgi:prepilin signal peptidase PulO-like enzyme (type II secretory pathway)